MSGLPQKLRTIVERSPRLTQRQQWAYLEAADELERLQRNAARYEWLRNVNHQGARLPDGCGLLVVTDKPACVPRYMGPVFGDALDKAVDAAMAAPNTRDQ